MYVLGREYMKGNRFLIQFQQAFGRTSVCLMYISASIHTCVDIDIEIDIDGAGAVAQWVNALT